jgi:hypothetical protein
MKLVLILINIINLIIVSHQQQQQKSCSNCYYGITRNNENEYLMVKNILKNLVDHHINITMDSLHNFEQASTKFLKTCDGNVDYICIKQTIVKDYRHPNRLFKGPKSFNETIKHEYEASWFLNHKLIDVSKHENKKHANFCNNLGLKLYCLLFDYVSSNGKLNVCKMVSTSQDEIISSLIDVYIAQTFIKTCYGNLEMISRGFYKLLKFDCERAYTMRLTYFTSKYLNLFRTCDPYSNLNDLIMNKLENNCSSALHNLRNKKHCIWYEAVCKYPIKCLKTMNWTDN